MGDADFWQWVARRKAHMNLRGAVKHLLDGHDVLYRMTLGGR